MSEREMVEVVRQLGRDHYGLVHLGDVRAALGLDRPTFVALLQRCRRAGLLTCSGAERCRDRLAEGVKEDGLTLLFVAVRE